jgi:hypothetical protein
MHLMFQYNMYIIIIPATTQWQHSARFATRKREQKRIAEKRALLMRLRVVANILQKRERERIQGMFV